MSQNTFIADFYRLLAGEEDGNLFYSPYSLYTAMAVVYAGAAGNTAVQFQDVMNVRAAPERFHGNLNSLDLTLLNDSLRPGQADSDDPDAPPTLSVANGLWLQDGLEVQPEFLNTATANYGIGLQQLDFRKAPDGAVKTINQWVDKATQGKIKGAINRSSITDDTSLVVTNAVYFKGDWEYQFEEENTTDQPFYLLDGKVVQVPMMFQREDYGYRLGEGYTAMNLPYRGYNFDLLIVMPDEGTFETFEESLTGDRLQAITAYMGSAPVILQLPRFKLEYSFSARAGLQGLGLGDAFDRKRADFRPIASSLFGEPIEELWIEDAVQKAFIEVNEKGSEAAAATAFFGAVTTSIPPPPVEITIDRPFIFLLRHSETGAVLFMGRVLNPEPEAPKLSRSEIPPTPTKVFVGIATLNGETAPGGTEVGAFDRDREIGQATVGDGGKFALLVEDSDGPITFHIAGIDAQGSIPEWSGVMTFGLNLTVARSEIPPTPEPPYPTSQPQSPPMVFVGIATLNGETAAVGTEIVAYEGDREIGLATVGEGGTFALLAEESEGPINFYIAGVVAQKSEPKWNDWNGWNPGVISADLNLTVSGGS